MHADSDDENKQPLWFLVDRDNQRELWRRLNQGEPLDPDEPVYRGTVLMEAVIRNDVGLVETFIMRGAKVSAQNPITKDTALHFACYGAKADMVELLLRHRANVDAKNQQGETPLLGCGHSAKHHRHQASKCVQLLLAYGADPHARDSRGRNVLDRSNQRLRSILRRVLPETVKKSKKPKKVQRREEPDCVEKTDARNE